MKWRLEQDLIQLVLKKIGGFRGIFNGSGKSIENIFENIEDSNSYGGGLFCFISNGAVIENLTVSGNISSKWHTGGIAGNMPNGSAATIRNCINKVNIIGYNSAGGILGYGGATETAKVIIENCDNYGNINITEGAYLYTGAGGIAGNGITAIRNCNNYGKISGNYRMGGIVGYTSRKNNKLYE